MGEKKNESLSTPDNWHNLPQRDPISKEVKLQNVQRKTQNILMTWPEAEGLLPRSGSLKFFQCVLLFCRQGSVALRWTIGLPFLSMYSEPVIVLTQSLQHPCEIDTAVLLSYFPDEEAEAQVFTRIPRAKSPWRQKDRCSGQSVLRPSLLPTTLFRQPPLSHPFENADHCFSWLLWPRPSPFSFRMTFIHGPTFRLAGFRD